MKLFIEMLGFILIVCGLAYTLEALSRELRFRANTMLQQVIGCWSIVLGLGIWFMASRVVG